MIERELILDGANYEEMVNINYWNVFGYYTVHSDCI